MFSMFYLGKTCLGTDIYGGLDGKKVTGRNCIDVPRVDNRRLVTINNPQEVKLEGKKKQKLIRIIEKLGFNDDLVLQRNSR